MTTAVSGEASQLFFGDPPFLFEGLLEHRFGGAVVGWVWLPSQPDRRVTVELIQDGKAIAAAIANLHRGDVAATGRGDGAYGFYIPLRTDGSRDLCARVANTAFFLPGILAPSDHRIAQPPRGGIDQVVGLTIKGWCWRPDEPDHKVSVQATLNGEVLATAVADDFRSDLVTAGIGDGTHAFVLRLPLSLADGGARQIALASDDGTPLAGSPASVQTIAGGPAAVLDRLRRALGANPSAEISQSLEMIDCYFRQMDELLPHSLPWRDYPRWRPPLPPIAPDQTAPCAPVAGGIGVLGPMPGIAVLVDSGATVLPGALERACQVFRQTDADVLYGDAEVATPLGLTPWFRPDWSYDLFLAQDYTHGLMLFRASVLTSLPPNVSLAEAKVRAVEAARPHRIVHLPEVLTSLTGDDPPSGEWQTALAGHFSRRGIAAAIRPAAGGGRRILWPVPAPAPPASIIIPTRDRVDLLANCIDSIRRRTSYQNYEIIVINNQSRQEETLRFLSAGARSRQFRVVDYDAPFNFSAMNNAAASLARGTVLGFVNNDIELISPDWLEQAIGFLDRPEIGALGARLRFANGMIQHGGVVLGIGGLAENAFQHLHADEPGYFHRTQLAGNYSAVTAACLFIRTQLFNDIGGFDADNLPVAFTAVDLCLRLRERGYLIAWTPHIDLFHHESASRGREDSDQRRARAFKEETYMRRRWGPVLMQDPFYNANLNLDGRPFTGLALPPRHRWGAPLHAAN